MRGDDLGHCEHPVLCDHAAAVGDRGQHLGSSEEQRLLWTGCRLDMSERGGGGLHQVIDNGHDGRVLGSKVTRKVRRRYVGGGGNLLDSRGFIPAPDTETQGGIDKPFAAILLRRHGGTVANFWTAYVRLAAYLDQPP